MLVCLNGKCFNQYKNLNKTFFNFDCLINECVEEFKIIAGNKYIDIIYYPSNIFIYANKNQIKRVLINLINITLFYADEKTNLHIISSKKKNLLFLEVKTHRNCVKNSILSRFCTKSVEKIEDFYIGLYSARKIIEAHNGKFHITSRGNETTFLFTIPMNFDAL